MFAPNTRKPRAPKVSSCSPTLQPLGPTWMGQNSLTSSGGKVAGIALLGEREIEPGIPARVEDFGLSGTGFTNKLVLPSGLTKPVQARSNAGPSFRHESLIGAAGPGLLYNSAPRTWRPVPGSFGLSRRLG
jgi:hypothetical protein